MEVEEEAAIGTIIGYVSASDRDLGNNALIDYGIISKQIYINLSQTKIIFIM